MSLITKIFTIISEGINALKHCLRFLEKGTTTTEHLQQLNMDFLRQIHVHVLCLSQS